MTLFKTPLEGALYFARKGWPVFPTRPNGEPDPKKTKSPVSGFTKWETEASADEKKILEWAQKYPNCNWGFPAGRAGVVVIDVDRKPDRPDGLAQLSAWAKEDAINSFPQTFEVLTTSGGIHFYYLAKGIGSKNGWKTSIDIKSIGGYVLVPGSVVNGRPYTIQADRAVAALPSGLTLPKAGESVATKAASAPASSDDFSLVLADILDMQTLQEGNRDNTLIALCLDWKERGMGYSARMNLLRLMDGLGKIERGADPLTDADFKRINSSAEKKVSAVYGSRTAEATFGEAVDGAYSAADLPGMDLKAPEFLVDGLVPKGIGFIAGPPKFGKTFLNLQLAVSIASGTPFLGREVPKQQKVLYLYLEGDAAQVYTRLTSIYGPGFVPPRDLIILHKCPPLDAGGRVVLRKLMQRYHPDLTIFDTWQLVREDTGARGQTAYMKEYREIENMREEIAEQFGTSILLTHHTKQVSSRDYVDALNRLNGSTALGGCSDYSLILLGTRGEDTFTLTAHGRNFEDVSIPLVREKPMRWVVSKDGASPLLVAETDLQQGIVDVLTANPDGLGATDIHRLFPPALRARHPVNTVTQQLNRWYGMSKIDKAGKKFRLFQTKQENVTEPCHVACHVSGDAESDRT